jgi:hypothetical protein
MIEDELRAFLDRAFSLGAAKKDLKKLMTRYLNNDTKNS